MKNNIEITKNAENHIESIINNDYSKYFRITVNGGGCAGFQYKFDFSDKINIDDNIFKFNKISVIVDNTSLNLIKGSKIDYVKELIGSTFKITNPQAS